jgi:nucleoid DNA-binding protein
VSVEASLAESETVTRVEIIEAMASQSGLTRDEANEVLECTLETITEALAAGGAAKVAKFGSFSTRRKSEREGRNPTNGEKAIISARTVVGFKPATGLRDQVRTSNQ